MVFCIDCVNSTYCNQCGGTKGYLKNDNTECLDSCSKDPCNLNLYIYFISMW